MRRCSMHGSETNCSQFYPGGQCPGVLNGTSGDDDIAREEAQVTAGIDASTHDVMLYAESQPTYEEAHAQLVMAGIDAVNARIMLRAPGSPYEIIEAKADDASAKPVE